MLAPMSSGYEKALYCDACWPERETSFGRWRVFFDEDFTHRLRLADYPDYGPGGRVLLEAIWLPRGMVELPLKRSGPRPHWFMKLEDGGHGGNTRLKAPKYRFGCPWGHQPVVRADNLPQRWSRDSHREFV
jgi:hypothetical protein